jgi:hypothetical protein
MAPFGSPSSGMNIPIRVNNTNMGEVKTLRWVEGSESTWFGRTLRHGRQKAVFCVKNEVREERTQKKKLAGGFLNVSALARNR